MDRPVGKMVLRILEVRLALRIFLALLTFQITGLPNVAMAIIEHVACDDEGGDGCCPTGCSDDDRRCEDCACCFHVRPMLPQHGLVIGPGTGGEVAPAEPSATRPNTDPREILHVPRRSRFLFS